MNEDFQLDLTILGAVNLWLQDQEAQGEDVLYTPGDTTAELSGMFAIDELVTTISERVREYYQARPDTTPGAIKPSGDTGAQLI